MELNFIKPKESNSIAKITVQKSGRLGFSKGAMEMLDIENNLYCKFGFNDVEELFIVMFSSGDSETFNIAKAGDYYYLQAKTLLADLGIDYKSKDTVIFDIQKSEKNNVFKMMKRVISK